MATIGDIKIESVGDGGSSINVEVWIERANRGEGALNFVIQDNEDEAVARAVAALRAALIPLMKARLEGWADKMGASAP